jgi:hypothetical protein
VSEVDVGDGEALPVTDTVPAALGPGCAVAVAVDLADSVGDVEAIDLSAGPDSDRGECDLMGTEAVVPAKTVVDCLMSSKFCLLTLIPRPPTGPSPRPKTGCSLSRLAREEVDGCLDRSLDGGSAAVRGPRTSSSCNDFCEVAVL